MDKRHFLLFFRPGIASSRTGIDTEPLVALFTHALIKNDMRITIYIEARVIKDFIKIDVHKDLQPE